MNKKIIVFLIISIFLMSIVEAQQRKEKSDKLSKLKAAIEKRINALKERSDKLSDKVKNKIKHNKARIKAKRMGLIKNNKSKRITTTVTPGQGKNTVKQIITMSFSNVNDCETRRNLDIKKNSCSSCVLNGGQYIYKCVKK